MLTRPVLLFVILSAWSIRQSESLSEFNRSLCSDTSVLSEGDRIVGGEVGPRNKWPWLVALVKKADNEADNEFLGDGSLISERFILTAAHYIQNKGDKAPLTPKDVNIHLGKWNISDATEQDAVLATVEKIIVHADWNVSDTRWDADIAIVKLADDVKLSKSIQPICLWTSQMQPDETNDGGVVVGWVTTENQKNGEHSNVPQEVEIRGLPISDCSETDGLSDVISRHGLCIGGKGSGTRPCNGDSGGGFFTARGHNWFLRGINSVSRINSAMECDELAPTIFTNVEKFTSWIDQVLDGDEELKCEFFKDVHYYYYYSSYYTCQLQNSFTRRDTKIFQVSGSHVGGRTNEDVLRLTSSGNEELKFLPTNLGRFFPNLKSYEVVKSGVEEISRRNFPDLPNLTRLEIIFGQLKAIPVDTFYDLATLKDLRLNNNQIEAIDSSTFIHNGKLYEIYLQDNKITSLDSTMFMKNLELLLMDFSNNSLTTIGPELLTPLESLRFFDFRNNTCIDKDWVGDAYTYEFFPPSVKKDFKETFARQCQ